MSQLELEEKLEHIENARPDKLLKSMSFKCGACAQDVAVSKFIHMEKNPAAYLQSIIQDILMNGACSICLRCKLGIDVQTCVLCEQEKDRSEFAKRTDYTDKWRCLVIHALAAGTLKG